MTRREELEADEVTAGDLVIIPYANAREQIGCGEEVGWVLEDRRHVLKVLLPEMGRVFWLERGVLERVEAGRLATDPLVERLHRLARLVNVDLVDLQDGTLEAGIVHLYSRGMRWEQAEEARAILGDAIQALWIEPANMRRLRLRIEMRGATPRDDVEDPDLPEFDPL
ncbi:MAG: hypothetical protein H6806_01625 [Planctomycetes bacterium]|nr:hypothetical protein [Planctomycetota bacterium]MCB9900951.1 hypothetical protein [Planctomycetota bacterium]